MQKWILFSDWLLSNNSECNVDAKHAGHGGLVIPCGRMQHRLGPTTAHRSNLSCRANSDVPCPMRDIVQEIQLFDHVLLARLWNVQQSYVTQCNRRNTTSLHSTTQSGVSAFVIIIMHKCQLQAAQNIWSIPPLLTAQLLSLFLNGQFFNSYSLLVKVPQNYTLKINQ